MLKDWFDPKAKEGLYLHTVVVGRTRVQMSRLTFAIREKSVGECAFVSPKYPVSPGTQELMVFIL